MSTAATPVVEVEGFFEIHKLIDLAEVETIFCPQAGEIDDETGEGVLLNCTAEEWNAAVPTSADEDLEFAHAVSKGSYAQYTQCQAARSMLQQVGRGKFSDNFIRHVAHEMVFGNRKTVAAAVRTYSYYSESEAREAATLFCGWANGQSGTMPDSKTPHDQAPAETATAVHFADAETADVSGLIQGEQVIFDPWEYALKPLPGQQYSGWFPLGRPTLISGSSGSMKTTFMTQALVAGRDGETFLGHEPGGMPFYFFFADRGKWDVEETFSRMRLTGKVPYECVNSLSRDATISRIATVARSGDYKILFIDGGDILVGDNNDGKFVAPFISMLQQIGEHYGVGLVISTGSGKHSQKALKEGAERRTIVKGSEVWSRMGGSVFTLNSEHDGTLDTRRLVVQHRNAGAERFLLSLKNGRLVSVNESALTERKQDMAVLDWVWKEDKFTRAKFAKAFQNMSGTTINKRLDGLEKGGIITSKTPPRSDETIYIVLRHGPATDESETPGPDILDSDLGF